MNLEKNIQLFIDKIDEVSNYTLIGEEKFEEIFKLKLYKKLLLTHFTDVEIGNKVKHFSDLEDLLIGGAFLILYLNINHIHKKLVIKVVDGKLASTEYK